MANKQRKYNEITPKLKASFVVLELLYVLTGAVLIVFGVLWLQTSGVKLQSFVVTRGLLVGGLIVGGLVGINSLIAIPPFLSPLRRKSWLQTHAVLIIITAIALLTLGARIWFTTLEERKMLGEKWFALNDNGRAIFQDQLQCCGWTNVTEAAAKSNFCTQETLSNPDTPPCINKLPIVSDRLLRRLFTTLFGFIGVDIFIFFATIIFIQAINVEQRYEKIDEKNGASRHFV
jgi:hypothetical protein